MKTHIHWGPMTAICVRLFAINRPNQEIFDLVEEHIELNKENASLSRFILTKDAERYALVFDGMPNEQVISTAIEKKVNAAIHDASLTTIRTQRVLKQPLCYLFKKDQYSVLWCYDFISNDFYRVAK